MQDLFSPVINGAIGWLIGFGLGLLVRKKVARSMVNLKRWIMDTPITIDLLAVSRYNLPSDMNECVEFTDVNIKELRKRLGNLQVRQIFPNSVWFISDLFGKIVLSVYLSNAQDEAEDTDDMGKAKIIELSLKTDISFHIGRRKLRHLSEFSNYVCEMFHSYEMFYTPPLVPLQAEYVIADIKRDVPLVDQKEFKRKDDQMDATIRAYEGKIEISLPPRSLMRAVEKYHFI
ncbi:MAG: hypothetical protein M1351_02215 [Candidatus Thermoplasmatota archaeon]|nr:hypothetical protein [Candidatus Thermoplasmatota archaeon]